jgi:uncharacterized BrkB/YihY/UPF0761 family membrane protein
MNPLTRVSTVAKLEVEKARSRFGSVDVVVETFRRFSRDDGGSYTAALTYYTFFSIFPILLFSASIVGFLTAGNEALKSTLLQAGLDAVPLLRDVLSPDHLEAIERGRGSLAITGLVMTLYAGTGAIVALQHALNRFNGVTDEPNWLQRRLRSLKFLAMFGLAALLSLGLGGLSSFATDIFAPEETLGGQKVEVNITGEDQDPPTATITVAGHPEKVSEGGTFGDGRYLLRSVDADCVTVESTGGKVDTLCTYGGRGFTTASVVGFLLGHLTGFLVGILIFASAFKFLPVARAGWKDVLPGAVIASLAFEFLKEFGAAFLARGSSNRAATFGVFAISAALLVACFLMSQVTLMAAEINNVLIDRRLTRQNLLPQPKGG